MTRISKLKILFLFFTLCFMISAVNVEAAEVFFEIKNQEVGLGSQFKIDVVVDTSGQSINAVEGRVTFPPELLRVKEISDGNSVINFWIRRPKIDAGGEIFFSGIIAGGYGGKNGKLFSIVFQAAKEGGAALRLGDLRVLLNDGEGTPAELKILNYELKISGAPASESFSSISLIDIEPPESFSPQIISDPNVFEGKWFLVFATQDKNSGMDHFEISEGGRGFIVAESPYLLGNQNLDQAIFVKAVDRSGNERMESLPPRNPRARYKNYAILAIIILIAAVVFVVQKYYGRKR